MEHATTAWDSGRFNRRVSTFAHAMIIISLAVVWLILLKGVLQPFFIALGIYFVLKPGSDYLSANGFPVMLSYLTMVLLTLLVVFSASFFAYQQAADVLEDEEKMDEYKIQKSADNADHADSKSSPMKTGGAKMGGTPVKTGGGAEDKGRPAPTAQKMSDFENTPGKDKGTSMKKEVKPQTADGSEKSAKSPISGK